MLQCQCGQLGQTLVDILGNGRLNANANPSHHHTPAIAQDLIQRQRDDHANAQCNQGDHAPLLDDPIVDLQREQGSKQCDQVDRHGNPGCLLIGWLEWSQDILHPAQ